MTPLTFPAELELGSMLDIGAYRGSPAARSLLERQIPALLCDPAPDAALALHELASRHRAQVLPVALTRSARRLEPFAWTPDAPYSMLTQLSPARAPAGVIPILVPASHPTELYELWDALPEPRAAIVDIGPGSLDLLDLICTFVRIQAVQLTVAGDEEARNAGAWLSTWNVLATDGLTVQAVRP